MSTKVYKIRNCDELNEWDLRKVKTLGADYFIYNYKNEGYEGTGIAIWKKDGKYGYAYLGHCSCDGPVEDLNSIYYTLEELDKLARGDSYEWNYAEPVMAKVRKLEA